MVPRAAHAAGGRRLKPQRTARRRTAAWCASAALAAAALLCALLPLPAAAGLAYCNPGGQLGADDKDRLLRFAAVVKGELERSGARLALIARSGLDLRRIAVRYSHAGVTLRASPETPWAVRQIYYACDAGLPRLFDQGMSAFLMGTDDARVGYISLVFLPEPQAAALERAVLDDARALALVAAEYSANAYPFSLRYQNCNQWLAELLASAWGEPDGADGTDGTDEAVGSARRAAQRWLRKRGYEPSRLDIGWWLMRATAFVPWLHRDDHPAEDLERNVFRVSLPADLEAFARAQAPGATRVELCHAEGRVVLRRGWTSIAEGCRPGAGDEVTPLP